MLVRNIYFIIPYIFFRVFHRNKIKYRIIIMKLCTRKCEVCKKIKIRTYVMIKQK